MEIQPNTKVNDLLNAYPSLEAFLIELNPKYRKLKNPILRRTVAKIATLTQVARIGGYDAVALVNKLREQVGQDPLEENTDGSEEVKTEEAPSWVETTPKAVMDANELLDKEKNPLAEATAMLKSFHEGEILLVKSDFLPSPLIDTFLKQGHGVYTSEKTEGEYLTYIRKKS